MQDSIFQEKVLFIAGKSRERVGNRWRQLETVGDNWRRLETVGGSPKQSGTAGEGVRNHKLHV